MILKSSLNHPNIDSIIFFLEITLIYVHDENEQVYQKEIDNKEEKCPQEIYTGSQILYWKR